MDPQPEERGIKDLRREDLLARPLIAPPTQCGSADDEAVLYVQLATNDGLPIWNWDHPFTRQHSSG
jgi:hypothetical protein